MCVTGGAFAFYPCYLPKPNITCLSEGHHITILTNMAWLLGFREEISQLTDPQYRKMIKG